MFQLGGRLVALCAGSPTPIVEAIDRYALLFGRAFQIADDLEDQGTPGESRANLPELIGARQSRTEAMALLDSAIESVAAIDTRGAMCAFARWLQRRMEAASTSADS